MEPLSDTEREWGRRLGEGETGTCLEADELLLLSERGRRTPDAERMFAHVAGCPSCRRALKELRALSGFVNRSESRNARFARLPRILPWAAGLAAAALLFFIADLWFGRPSALPSKLEEIAEESAPKRSVPAPGQTVPPRELSRPILPQERGSDSIQRKRSDSGWTPSRRRRGFRPLPKIAMPVPIIDRGVETMDANVGWTRDEVSGEVLGGNVASGEVTSSNVVQGEVGGSSGSLSRPPQQSGR